MKRVLHLTRLFLILSGLLSWNSAATVLPTTTTTELSLANASNKTTTTTTIATPTLDAARPNTTTTTARPPNATVIHNETNTILGTNHSTSLTSPAPFSNVTENVSTAVTQTEKIDNTSHVNLPDMVTGQTENDTTTVASSNATENVTLVTQKPGNVSEVADNTTTVTQSPTSMTVTEQTDNDTSTASSSNITTTQDPFANSSTGSSNVTDSVSESTATNVTEMVSENTTLTGLDNMTITEAGNTTAYTTGTTEASNVTSTEKSMTTTRQPWKPPDPSGNSGFGPNTSNLTVIIVPILAILILCTIAVCVFVMCKRARKEARRTRSPEEVWSAKKTEAENQNTAASPFITSPYRSGEAPAIMGHENLAYEKDDENKKSAPNDCGAQKRGATQEHKPLETKNGNIHTTGYDQLKHETGHDRTWKLNYEKLNTENDVNIELANIVIESDPDDINRYFRKTDIGDWYRQVVKKKQPKDTEKLLDKSEAKVKSDKHTKDKRKRNSESHEHDSDKKSDGKHRRDSSHHRKHRSHSADKQRHRSSEHKLSSTVPKSSDDKIASKERLSASLPMQSSAAQGQSVRSSPTKQSATPPPTRVIMSRPLSADKAVSGDTDTSKSVETKASMNMSQVPAPQPRVIMSRPKSPSDSETKAGKAATVLPSQKRPENVPRLNLPK